MIVQFAPARAKKKIAGPHELYQVNGFLTEQKIDGQRYVLHAQKEATSRRISVETQRFVEKGDRVPHLLEIPLPLDTMIDCEFVSPMDAVLVDLPNKYWERALSHPHLDWLRNKYDGAIPVYPHVSSTTSIMGSSPQEAIRKQNETGNIWAYAFDIVQYMGKSTVKNPQMARRNFLAKQLRDIDPEQGLILMPCWYGLSKAEQEDLFHIITDEKGEGLILKDPEKSYNHARAWWKWKIDFPVDAILTGEFSMGQGKLEGMLGNLEIGVYKGDVLYPVGYISAIMDSESKLPELTDRAFAGELAGLVVECRHNGTQNKPDAPLGYTLRHPRFRRWRTDKDPMQCTSEILLAEVK